MSNKSDNLMGVKGEGISTSYPGIAIPTGIAANSLGTWLKVCYYVVVVSDGGVQFLCSLSKRSNTMSSSCNYVTVLG